MNIINGDKKARLDFWKERYAKASIAYSEELEAIAKRDNAYNGIVEGKKYVENDTVTDPRVHIRNIIAEIIEAEVDTSIPQPKVTAKRKEDEILAKHIEDMLRAELDRCPFELINDFAERCCPIQGGTFYSVEWDSTKRTHTTVGAIRVDKETPKQVIPEPGMTELDDMEYFFVLVAQNKDYIKRRYGVTLSEDAAEDAPEIRYADDSDTEHSDDLVTQYVAYFRNERGGIGMYSWVLDTELCYFENYQARRVTVCTECGTAVPEAGYTDTECPVCGGRSFEERELETEVITSPVMLSDGTVIVASEARPVELPYYSPDVYPVVLQRNVTAFGKFLGNSDVDLIYDQQVAINRLHQRIIEKLLHGGSYSTLPDDATIKTDNAIGKVIYLSDPSKKSLIGSYDLTCDINQELNYIQYIYDEARKIINITDSFQGRNDSTATSKVAKEFAAKQTAGRLESKRQMKNWAYSRLFELIFKFRLAYSDEPIPTHSATPTGDPEYGEFNRYDFLRRDAAGEWYYVDDFTFSVDSAAPLASNREAMWQETRMNLESGAFGDHTRLETLILFWSKMELLHYPGASETKRYLVEQKHEQGAAAQAQMQEQQAQMQNLTADIDAQARAAAERDAAAMQAEQMMKNIRR